MSGAVIWDFDGTLAYRTGMWSGCLLEVLDAHEDHSVSEDDLRPLLRAGFPWDASDVPHPELATAVAWWDRVEAVLAAAYAGVGYPPAQARELARLAHERYVDCRHSWHLFDDTLPTLARLREQGWRHVVLSNHVPELDAIIDGLGLSDAIDAVVNSAVTGYEKPHPEAFALARRAAGDAQVIWMVGDNVHADVNGAEAAGIPAVLVRTENVDATRTAATLHDVELLLRSHV